jgi:predicted TIM-barrel fold metal-dependent hydrolase
VTRFIDLHVHPPVAEFLEGPFAPFLDGLARHRGSPIEPMSLHDLAAHYRERDGRAVLLAWDAETATRRRPLTNETVARFVADHPDVFFGFGSIDPHKGAAAVAEVHEARRLGLRGLMVHPAVQGFSPSDRMAYPVWETAEALRLPVLVHTGFTWVGGGEPGGSGIQLGHSNPLHVDRMAADFPRLQIVLVHPSWPWTDVAVAVAVHKGNVYLELSGWPPDRLPAVLLDRLGGPLADRVLFGTDFPIGTPDEWMAAWERADLPDSLTRAVLHDNAARLLGLAPG